MRACRQHNCMFTKLSHHLVNAHSNISLKWMDFRSASCTHIIWQRQCIKIKQPLYAACFSGKRAKQAFLDWSIKNFLQPILPLVHKHHMTNRDSGQAAEPHHFLRLVHIYVIGDSHIVNMAWLLSAQGVYLHTKNMEKR